MSPATPLPLQIQARLGCQTDRCIFLFPFPFTCMHIIACPTSQTEQSSGWSPILPPYGAPPVLVSKRTWDSNLDFTLLLLVFLKNAKPTMLNRPSRSRVDEASNQQRIESQCWRVIDSLVRWLMPGPNVPPASYTPSRF